MIGFLLSPVARWAFVGVILVGAVFSIYAKGRIDGRQQAITKIETANKKAEGKADAAERDVLSCPPGKWNKEAHRCAP